jgi:uncharacterized membrane protein YgcG
LANDGAIELKRKGSTISAAVLKDDLGEEQGEKSEGSVEKTVLSSLTRLATQEAKKGANPLKTAEGVTATPAQTWIRITDSYKLSGLFSDLGLSVRRQVRVAGWFKFFPDYDLHRWRAKDIVQPIVIVLIVTAVIGGLASLSDELTAAQVFPAIGIFLGCVAAVLIPILVIRLVLTSKDRRGQLSAVGRAQLDQVEGFREYLTKAEADQLRFAENQNVFLDYLPWAMVFGIAEKWVKVCERLIEQGRLQAQPTSWALTGTGSNAINEFLRSLSRLEHSSESRPVYKQTFLESVSEEVNHWQAQREAASYDSDDSGGSWWSSSGRASSWSGGGGRSTGGFGGSSRSRSSSRSSGRSGRGGGGRSGGSW